MINFFKNYISFLKKNPFVKKFVFRLHIINSKFFLMLPRRVIGLCFSGWSLLPFLKCHLFQRRAKLSQFSFRPETFFSLRHFLKISTKYGSITGKQHLIFSFPNPSWLVLLLFSTLLTIFQASSKVVGNKAIVSGLRWIWGIIYCLSSNFFAKASPLFVNYSYSFNVLTSRVLKLGWL